MKKLFVSLLALTMLLSLAACGDGSDEATAARVLPTGSPTIGFSLSDMSEDQKEMVVLSEAKDETVNKLKADFTFDESKTTYSLTESACITKTDTGEDWSVSGTVNLYDSTGKFIETATFRYDDIYIDAAGSAVSVGHYEITAGSKSYHN